MKLVLMIASIACLISCRKHSHGHSPSGLEPLLTPSEVEHLGFKTMDLRRTVQDQWEQDHFGSASIVEQEIRSLNPMEGDASLYPRYTLVREMYDRPEAASDRFKRLRDHNPDRDNKMNAGLVLRDGFVVGEAVWIITTDAVVFSDRELQKVKSGIASLKQSRGEKNTHGNAR